MPKEHKSHHREDDDRRSKKKRKEERDDENSLESKDRKRSKSSKHRKKKRSKEKKERKRKQCDSSQSSGDESHTSGKRKRVVNERLLAKLEARGETLEERNARRSKARATVISQKFGYTAESNPFNDPNLHEKFSWKKRDDNDAKKTNSKSKKIDTFNEIEKVRQRRKDRDLQREEMERIKAEESRMKELENYDEWAKKEEEFHLQQQRQRSAIRLVEGRERPVDILAKNLLLFGLSDEEKRNRSSIKYQEKYNAMEELENLEVELEEPHSFVKLLKLEELLELQRDISSFQQLEREARASDSPDESVIIRYWDTLAVVVDDEVQLLQKGGKDGSHSKTIEDVKKIFKGQSKADLLKMKNDIESRLRSPSAEQNDREYWLTVLEQLNVYLSKMYISDEHSKMLVRQLEKLEKHRDELANARDSRTGTEDVEESQQTEQGENREPDRVEFPEGDLEEELGLTSEIDIDSKNYAWKDKFRPRKPRYFNRVRTGYDWNNYNKQHYDKDNPPPKTVQGYKFNVFYTDLIDPTKTPTFTLEPADSDEFCIIRFRAGAPYEDIAFKIINREWNKSRKKGFKSSFERGVLSLYFNFTTHWYRR